MYLWRRYFIGMKVQSGNARLSTETLGNIYRQNSGTVINCCEKYICTSGCNQQTITHSVSEKFKLSSIRSSSPWKRQRFNNFSTKYYVTSWVMNLVNLSAVWTQTHDDVGNWRPNIVLSTSGCVRMNNYIIQHVWNSSVEFLKDLTSLIMLLF